MISFESRHARRALRAALAAIFLPLLLAMMPAPAAPNAPTAEPVLALSVRKVVVDPVLGERLVPAETVRAGDILEYQAVYTNSTARPLKDAQVTLPVPARGVAYQLDSAAPSASLASVDGKRFAPLPLMRLQADLDGRQVERPAPAADYRYLRWNLGLLEPGASRTVRARAELLPVVTR